MLYLVANGASGLNGAPAVEPAVAEQCEDYVNACQALAPAKEKITR
jgi:hypothetical protein